MYLTILRWRVADEAKSAFHSTSPDAALSQKHIHRNTTYILLHILHVYKLLKVSPVGPSYIRFHGS
jgi:hypothetical protein